MSLRDEINELEAYNFLIAAYASEIENTLNFKKLDFYPPFHQPNIFRKEPDFILINKNEGYALIVECKSGKFQPGDSNEKSDIKQAESYINLPLREVESECKRILQDRNFSLRKFDVAFQYYRNMIEIAEIEESEKFRELKTIVSIFSVNKEDQIYSLYPSKEITYDRLEGSLRNGGIKIPNRPDPQITLHNSASVELIAHAIIGYLLKHIMTNREIKLTLKEIDEDIIQQYQIKRERVKEALHYLSSPNISVLQKKVQHESGISSVPTSIVYIAEKKTITTAIRLVNILCTDETLKQIDHNRLASYNNM